MIRLYGIANCDSVKKARAWLQAEALACDFHDFKREGLAQAKLERWAAAAGWERLLNRQGTTWRRLDDAARAAAVTSAGACALMLAATSLVKRPVIEWPDGSITVGFDPGQFVEAARRSRSPG